MAKRYETDYADRTHHNVVKPELKRAIEKFPHWPNDPFHALTIIGEEFGELSKAVLQYHYEPVKGVTLEDIRGEAIQTIAMLHRFITSLECGKYSFPNTAQHDYPN